MVSNPRLGASTIRGLEQHSQGAVELLLRRLEVAILQLLLARLEVAFRRRDQR